LLIFVFTYIDLHILTLLFFFLILPPPPISTLFPYTTLFRSDSQIRVSGKKNAKAWNDSDAQQFAERAGVEIAQNGDGYEIHPTRSEEHTSELQSRFDLVCRLLLEKKKKKKKKKKEKKKRRTR